MGSGSGVDLFRGFNEGEDDEVLRRCVGCGRFVLIGPPRSGKTFFREKYLKGRLGAGVTVDEHTLGITTTTKTEGGEARGGLEIPERVVRLLKRMMPWIGKLVDEVRVKDEELRRILGDKAPRHVVEGARGMIGDSPHMAYYIPWKCVEEPNACTFDADASRALGLIKRALDDRKVRIRWFRVEYIPPGLVEEVIDLIKEGGEDGAREVLRGWVEAYSKADETLRKVLGLGEDLLSWDESSAAFLSNFVNNIASYVIGGLATIPISAAALTLISALTYIAFKREGENYLREIIDLRRSLEALRRLDGEFNELGELLVYRVAYAMRMSHDEAKRALMDITGLSIDELERRVNEIEGRIKELENKVELFRQEVPVDIVTANVGEFAKGGIYPNIKVENGELRIRVEDEYYNVVRAGRFNELVSEIKDRLLRQGFVVVVGPKGIGKSTLAAAVIWELLMNNDIGLVARVDRLDSKNYSEFATFVENYGERFSEYFGRLLILYDPVSTKAYEKVGIDTEAPVQSSIESTVKNLMDFVDSISPKASRPFMLIVLPSDIYNALSEEMRNALKGYRLDVSLSDAEFLARLIREYAKTRDKPSGCELSNDVFSKLADEVAGFDSGHALIARLIGEELARNNCSASEVEELINNAKGKAEAFIIQYINKLFKVHKNPNTAKALVEIFALRKPFVNKLRPSEPILTPGVIELIGKKRGVSLLRSAKGGELRSWLAIRQHDLIEEAIKKLLKCIVSEGEECKELGDTLKPWKTIGDMETLSEVSEKVRNEDGAVEYFASNYGEKLTNTLKVFSNCWKRAALIIGYASAGHDSVPRSEDLPSDVVGSLGDALGKCEEIDNYLLVGNKIPQLIRYLTYTRVLTKAFIDRYGEAVAEVNRILKIARGRGSINPAEVFYGLGLASIIANAAGSNKPIKPSDADVALHIASFAIQHVVLPILIVPILSALRPLRDYAPHRYLELLAHASSIENLDSDTVEHIFKELNEILDNYGDVIRGYAWSLMYAIDAYANLLRKHPGHFNRKEAEDVVGRVIDLLNELDRSKTSLGVIAWVYALAPALWDKDVRRLMEKALGIDVVGKASEVLGELSKLRGLVQDLMGDKEFMGYVESKYIKADEEAVKRAILDVASFLKHALALYRLSNDEFKEAEGLFNEAAEEDRETGDHESYLINRGWALRVEAIEGSLVGDELVDGFRQLYEETFSKEHFIPTAMYLSNASHVLGGYLVSLALTGDHETINKLLEEHLWVLNADEQVSVLTRLMLNALLGPRGGLSSELEGKLVVEPRELINAFGSHTHSELLPALRVALGITKPEDGVTMCMLINDSIKGMDCVYAISVAINNYIAVVQLREQLINRFRGLLSEKLGLLKELSADADAMLNEFRGLVYGFDGKSLVQLIAPTSSMAQLALMLHALINGDEELAKAHALYGAVEATGNKLLRRLFLEAYRACCDLGSEGFRLAIARLFFYHV